jgi:hypothetical protein
MSLATLSLVALGAQAKARCNHRLRVEVGNGVWWCRTCGSIKDGYGWRVCRRVWAARYGHTKKGARRGG